jgi:hypothetical protein
MGETDAAYLAARKALDASSRGGDPLLDATLRGSLAWQLLVQGRFTEGMQLAARAATTVEPVGDVSPEHLSVYGSLLLTGATSAGRARHGEVALDLVGEAREVATRIGHDRQDYETAFGPSQVTMQTVDVQINLENYVGALTAAGEMPADPGLPLAARARHMTDKAYAAVRVGHDDEALQLLLTMERFAPDWVQYQTLPRLVVGELFDSQRRQMETRQLVGLAQRLGVQEVL